MTRNFIKTKMACSENTSSTLIWDIYNHGNIIYSAWCKLDIHNYIRYFKVKCLVLFKHFIQRDCCSYLNQRVLFSCGLGSKAEAHWSVILRPSDSDVLNHRLEPALWHVLFERTDSLSRISFRRLSSWHQHILAY